MKCPICGAGLTGISGRWWCKYCNKDVTPEAAKCKTLDKYIKEGRSP